MTIATIKLTNHPDEGFAGKPTSAVPSTQAAVSPTKDGGKEVLSSLLTASVAALAASLDVDTPKGKEAYDPDAFVAALQRRHDELVDISRKLAKQNEFQREKQHELDRREAEVAFREKRADAWEKLQAKPKRWWQ
jgi:hypothetical protein